MKVSKNVTLTVTNFTVITQMMDKSRLNFSRALNIIIDDWIQIRRTIKVAEHKAKVEKELKQISGATVIKE
jgi:hypothetical protein